VTLERSFQQGIQEQDASLSTLKYAEMTIQKCIRTMQWWNSYKDLFAWY